VLKISIFVSKEEEEEEELSGRSGGVKRI